MYLLNGNLLKMNIQGYVHYIKTEHVCVRTVKWWVPEDAWNWQSLVPEPDNNNVEHLVGDHLYMTNSLLSSMYPLVQQCTMRQIVYTVHTPWKMLL